MQLDLPKLSMLKLSAYFADLWLASEGSEGWVRIPVVRRAWHFSFFSMVILLAVCFIVSPFLSGVLESWPAGTHIWRWFYVLAFGWLLACEAYLCYCYYRELLLTRLDLRFQNIVVFYVTWVILFACLFQRLYLLRPSLFLWSNPSVVPLSTLTSIPIVSGLRFVASFVTYSACTSLATQMAGLTAASAIISMLTSSSFSGSCFYWR